MATYQELAQEYDKNLNLDKIKIAITVAADSIINETSAVNGHAERVVWARDALNNPSNHAKSFLAAVLAANKDATITAIQGATDIQIQANVDAAVNIFAGVTT